MAKILLRKEKKEFIKEINKEVTIFKQKFFYIADETQDFMTDSGKIDKKELKKKDGSIVKTNINKEFIIFSADFIDNYRKIGRKAQIITPKDIGIILTETGINKDSKVVDAGTGSGALACYLARICKEVTSYDIREDAIELAKKNRDFLGLKNLKIKNKDIFNGIDEKELDLIVLDMPDPKPAIDSCEKSLKIGGYLIIYVPTILQISDFVNEIKKYDSFVYLKTVELIERQWKIDGRSVRPNSDAIGHTAFLCFCRKIR
jgi:tRNA (adenine57-N1/adenine58-N1)-methyltransferase catalytic subunit